MEAFFPVFGEPTGVISISGHSQRLLLKVQGVARLPCLHRINLWRHAIPNLSADACDTRGFAHVCWASSQGNIGHSSPNDEDAENNNHDSDDAGGLLNASDWRAFRAKLVATEAASEQTGSKQEASNVTCRVWSHPLHAPETGCLLIATEKLDGLVPFERSVILLLSGGSKQPQDRPFGLILNRPILHAINTNVTSKQMEDLLGKCQLFYGGPLSSNILLLMRDAKRSKGLVEIMPGIYYGYSDEVHEQMGEDTSLLGQDCRFYVGYAGWDFHQLLDEVKDGFWHMAACSSSLIKETPFDCLWQEVLALMGGPYAELSRKPKKDGP